MRSRLASVSALALWVVLGAGGCGGSGDDGDDDGSNFDAGDSSDAESSGVDAMGAYTGIGQTCDGAVADSCPAEASACLSLTDGTNPWCSKTCTMAGAIDPTCTSGYEGPGLVGCFYEITPEGGGAAMNVCGVVCLAPVANCAAAVCDGTCPGDLQCGTPNGDGVAFCS